MTEQVSIETTDATLAALVMRATVGRMRARLQECAGRGWRVLLLAEDGVQVSVRDVILLARGILRSRVDDEVTVRHGDRSFAVRAPAAAGEPTRKRRSVAFVCASEKDAAPTRKRRYGE